MIVRIKLGMPADASKCQWLDRDRDHVVLSIERVSQTAMGYRIMSRINRAPMVFDACVFDIVDPSRPASWVPTETEAGVEWSPQPWNEPGFWERAFDGDPEALKIYEQERDKIVGAPSGATS
jgi:hypothetical protein